jgi:hypothetical protein
MFAKSAHQITDSKIALSHFIKQIKPKLSEIRIYQSQILGKNAMTVAKNSNSSIIM